MKVATSSVISQGLFLVDSPVAGNASGRPVETTPYLRLAKRDFVDQTDVDAFVSARGGWTGPGSWVVLDLGAAGVK